MNTSKAVARRLKRAISDLTHSITSAETKDNTAFNRQAWSNSVDLKRAMIRWMPKPKGKIT